MIGQLDSYANRYRHALLDDCLPFWLPRLLDSECGGFLHCVDRDGAVVDTDKSVWAHGRMSWVLFELFNSVDPNEDWLRWGEHGLRFLEKHCFDDDGRMFFQVTRDGRPIRKRRYAFSESFASIAYAAHARATGDATSARRARELFDLFVRWNFTPGLMPAKFEDTRPSIAMAPRMIALVTAQELRECLGDEPQLRGWIDRSIDEIERYFVKPKLECVMEMVAPNGDVLDHFDGRTLNPGHAIEGAWFIMREGEFRNDPRLVRLGCQMLDWMWCRGWDNKFGGLFYFRDVHGKPVQEYWQDMKFWWPHDEALIATLMAWRLTGEERYAQWHMKLHDWAFGHFADPIHGEWFGYLHRDGSLSTSLKGNLWKAAFHHPRAMLRCWRMCDGNVGHTAT
ncbi:MAG: AGE family epimerase/isomerase [Candidatus Hydrogenedentales bacterium]|jgi:N-acylglucosamine 2-epimerase